MFCVDQEQDPAVWSEHAQQIMKNVTELRYYLLPFMYTQFYYSHLSGSPVIQPLFFVLVLLTHLVQCTCALRDIGLHGYAESVSRLDVLQDDQTWR